MKRILILISFLLVIVAGTQAQSHQNFGYTNSGWIGFSVKIPNNLNEFSGPNMPSINSIAEFSSRDGKVEVCFSTRLVSDYAPRTHYNNAVSAHSNIMLKTFKSNYYVLSGIEKGRVYYHVTKWNTEYICTAVISYPTTMKKYYDKACTVLLNSFCFD